jgi:hypothetical protein
MDKGDGGYQFNNPLVNMNLKINKIIESIIID